MKAAVLCVAVLGPTVPARGKTVVVNLNGGGGHTEIQPAIDAVEDGDEVLDEGTDDVGNRRVRRCGEPAHRGGEVVHVGVHRNGESVSEFAAAVCCHDDVLAREIRLPMEGRVYSRPASKGWKEKRT